MKKLSLLLLIGIIAFSCKKDGEKPNATLNGKWKLAGSSGGFASIPFQPTTQHYYYTFSLDGKYTTEYTERNEKSSGKYQTAKGNNIDRILMTADGSTLQYPYIYYISHDTLMLMEDMPDAMTQYFIKQ